MKYIIRYFSIFRIALLKWFSDQIISRFYFDNLSLSIGLITKNSCFFNKGENK